MIKVVGTAMYAHISNTGELYEHIKKYGVEKEYCQGFANIIISGYKNVLENLQSNSGHIVKFDRKTHNLSIIKCPTWDSLNEPIVGDSYCFRPDGSVKIIKGGTKVYHHKWQFVSDDYQGFDVQQAKDRSKQWESIPDIKSHKSKIGNKEYWYKLLQDNGLSI